MAISRATRYSVPKWATPARRNHLARMGTAYKGRCLRGHLPCRHLEHFIHRYTQVEIASGPVTVSDVRAGRAIAFPCRGVGIVELAHAVSGGPVIGPKRVPVIHEELSDLYGVTEERTIESWQQDDREERSELRKAAAQHAPTGEVGQFTQFSTPTRSGRRMDPVDMDNHVANRPRYYLLGYGVDGQLRRFAKVRIPGTRFILQVDVSESVQELSQRKRKWLHRQGIQAQAADAIIEAAVAQWWAS